MKNSVKCFILAVLAGMVAMVCIYIGAINQAVGEVAGENLCKVIFIISTIITAVSLIGSGIFCIREQQFA